MIYLLYGSDTTRSREKINEIVAEFRQKNGGDLNVHRFDAEETDMTAIKSALETPSLFARKKLAVIKYLSLVPERSGLYPVLEKIKGDRDTIVLLGERELDEKQLAELRSFCNKVQEFKLSKVNGQMSNVNIFHLGDTFFSSPREGLRALLELLHQGHDEKNVFAYLANHLRSLLTIKTYAEKNQPLPSSTGIHPYVAKKAALIIRQHTVSSLTDLLKRFFREDVKIKTGLSKPKESLLHILLSRK